MKLRRGSCQNMGRRVLSRALILILPLFHNGGMATPHGRGVRSAVYPLTVSTEAARQMARKVYRRQTEEAKTRGVSNCPDCANGHEANARRIYAFNEMEADHVSAWSRGGDTTEANCQMLCKHHNRVKGNC